MNTFNDEGLCNVLEELHQFEIKENYKVDKSGVGHNIDIKKARELKQIQRKMDSSNVDMHIDSSHSEDTIKAAFLSSAYILHLFIKLSHLAPPCSMPTFYVCGFGLLLLV